MRRRHRTLRELLAEIRRSPDDGGADARAGQCAEALFDQERCACHDLGEREEAALEAERRRWDHIQPANENVTTSSTGL